LSHDHPMAQAPQYPHYEPERAPPPNAPISTYAPVSFQIADTSNI